MTEKPTVPEIRARLEAATPGPWEATWRDDEWASVEIPDTADDTMQLAWHEGGGITAMDGANAEFIAHAPTDIAFLLEENERLERRLAEAQAEALDAAADEMRDILVSQRKLLGMPSDEWLRARAATIREGDSDV